MAEQIESFFWKLGYIKKTYEGFGEIGEEDGTQMEFNSKSKSILYRLIDFIENDYGTTTVSRFICRYWDRKPKELVELWEEETGRIKTKSCFRAQRSKISQQLNELFSDNIVELFFNEELDEINNLLKILKKPSISFSDVVTKEMQRFEFSEINDYEIYELSTELKAIKFYTSDAVKKMLSKLDMDKLFYIRRILNQDLIINDISINHKKLELLNALQL